MGALTVLLILINSTAFCAVMHVWDQVWDDTLRNITETIVENGERGGEFLPVSGPAKTLLDVVIPIHGVALDGAGRAVSVTSLFGSGELPEEALADILSGAKPGSAGIRGDYRYYLARDGGYLTVTGEGGSLRRQLALRLMKLNLVVGVPLLAVLFGICWLLSGYAVRPAREAVRLQRQFLADAGHELKTPIATIGVNAAALEADVGQNRYLDCIQEEARRMGGLVTRMMEVACLPGGAVSRPERRKEMDLTALVEQAALPFESVALERGLRYDLDIAEGVTCRADPEQLRQVADILLDNAFKYVNEGGAVSVCLRAEGHRGILEVSNSGPGIRPEDLPHIFERFYRCDKARPGNGSYGLGLAIAQAITQEQHGTLTAESQPGVRTVFRLTL